MPKEGQVWPLQLVCLLLLVLGLLTFIDPTLFGEKAPISREASLLLLGGAILTGIVLYSPLLTEIFKAGGAGGAINQRIGDPANPARDSVIGRIQTVETRVNALGDPNAARATATSILERLQAVQGQTAALPTMLEAITGPNPAQPPVTSMVGRLGALQTQMSTLAAAAIGTPDNPAANTFQKRLGDIETQLAAGIKELSEKLDQVAATLPQAPGGKQQ
jgi:hypothetical protein